MLVIFLGVISSEEKDLVNEIFSRMNEKMYYISYNILKSKMDAEEAVAQAFLKIIENIERISALPCPQRDPYCVIILKNEAMNIIRKQKNSIYAADMDYLGYVDQGYNIEDQVIEIVDWENLLSHIDRLSDDEKYFIQLRFFNEMGYKEISEFFDISEDAAKKRGQRILKKLRLIYEGGDNNATKN